MKNEEIYKMYACEYYIQIRSQIFLIVIESSMLRILVSLPYRFSTVAPPTKKYEIFKLAYLIEARPKRPAGSYALYVKQESAGKKIIVGKNSAELCQKWHKSPEIQEKFKKMSEENGKGYPQRNEQYINKFVTPFKKVTYCNVLMKKLSSKIKSQIDSTGKQKAKSIDAYGKQLKKILAENKSQEIQASKKEALKIKAERQAIISQYKFPLLEYKSFRSYQIRHSLPKEKRGPTHGEDLLNAYNEYLKKWRGETEQWLKANNYQITIDQFITLYEGALSAEKERKQGLEEQEQEQEQESEE